MSVSKAIQDAVYPVYNVNQGELFLSSQREKPLLFYYDYAFTQGFAFTLQRCFSSSSMRTIHDFLGLAELRNFSVFFACGDP